MGEGRFRAFSAGSHPEGRGASDRRSSCCDELGYPTDGLRSKSWDEFAGAGAPPLDFIFTVCDNAAGEICPIWPGHPITAHWGIEDPAAVEGDGPARGLRDAYRTLQRRIRLFLALPLDSIDRNEPAGAATRDRQRRRHVWLTQPPLARRLAAEGVGSFFLFADRDRLRHHGRATVGRERRGGAARQHDRDRRDPVRADHDARADLGRAHEPGGQPGRRRRGASLRWRDAAAYIVVQLAFGILGAWAAHLMFDLPTLQLSVKARTGLGQWTGEAIATFGLILTILGTVRHRPRWVPASVALYIIAAYWFTSSTSFANPAITVARSLSNSFAGIAPRMCRLFIARAADRRRPPAPCSPYAVRHDGDRPEWTKAVVP